MHVQMLVAKEAKEESTQKVAKGFTHSTSLALGNDGIGRDDGWHWTGYYTLVSVFTVIIIAGTVFGLVHEDWYFAQALLFSISGLSTGGLVAPSSDVSFGFMPDCIYVRRRFCSVLTGAQLSHCTHHTVNSFFRVYALLNLLKILF